LTRLGVLVSGRGSNLEAILAASRGGVLDADVAAVLANRECPALEVARGGAVAVVRAMPLGEFGGDASRRDAAMADQLEAAAVDLVACAGYDRILDEAFVARFAGRILNVHPSLLPAFGGSMTAIEEAFAAGVGETGVTIHYIEPSTVDAGTILAQEPVPVRPGDSLEDLAARVHAVEHRLYPATIQAWIEGRVARPQGVAR
jgi:formyltetrahydrofolate-dependent phosphoribosylglycinamide formyltransferase